VGRWWHIPLVSDRALEQPLAPIDAAHALEPFKTDMWRKLSPAERLRRSWLLYRRLVDPQAAHDRKLFPVP
jgi:hypothetical protein